MMRALVVAPLLAFALVACGDSVTEPSSGALVTFDVQGERFRIWLTGDDDVDAARRAQAQAAPPASRTAASSPARSSIRGGAGTSRT
jgi:hypothetical protein